MMSKTDAVRSGFTIIGSLASCIPFGGVVSGLLQSVGESTALIITLLESIEQNIEICKEIMSSVREVKETIEQFQKYDKKKLPRNVQLALCQLKNLKRESDIKCHHILKKQKSGHLLKADKYAKELKQISKALKEANIYLQQTLSTLTAQTVMETNDTLKIDYIDLRNQVLNPSDGIIINDKNYTALKPPNKPSAELNDQKNAMIVTWIDENNEKENVFKYELMINPDTKQKIPIFVEKSNPREMDRREDSVQPLKYSVSIFPPTVKERQSCEIKVRAVNGVGPSDWSDVLPFKYLTGRPDPPQITSVTATGPNEVEIQFVVQQEEGEPVTECLIEYKDVDDHKATSFITETCSELSPSKGNPNLLHGTFTAKKLDHNTRYLFKVTARTEIGDSLPSKSETVSTNSFLPGPPVEFRVLQPTSKDSISFMWGEPAHNVSGLNRYRIKHMKTTKGKWIGQVVILDKTQKKYTIENLKPGAKYFICFESLNTMGDSTPSGLIVATKRRIQWLNKCHKPVGPEEIEVLMADSIIPTSYDPHPEVNEPNKETEEVISNESYSDDEDESYEETVLQFDYENGSYSCLYDIEDFENDISTESMSDDENDDSQTFSSYL